MARDEAYRLAEQKIEKARRSVKKILDLSGGYDEKTPKLTELPESLSQLTQLTSLDLSRNQLTVLPEWLGQFTELESLDLTLNRLTALPRSLGQLTQLKSLRVAGNRLKGIPEAVRQLVNLRTLQLNSNELADLPDWLGTLTLLEELNLYDTGITDLPESLTQLTDLFLLTLGANPLNPELAAAHNEGLAAVKRYLRAKAEAQVILNETKLILIGEGEVGKSALLGALRGDPWEDSRPTTHGIEIKPIEVTEPATGRVITLNGWDFGGQRVYRPTHQLFFSSPAVYLVVWKPREGPQQGFVKEWIKLVKHREPDAKILVVATHGGPGGRQPDIDRQELWDLFGEDTIIDFFHVDSKPAENGERRGIPELKVSIARLAAQLPEVGRKIPKRWRDVGDKLREALEKSKLAYLPLERVIGICREHKMDEQETIDYVRISHRLGGLIHYDHDPLLSDVVILKPDWLATAISFVLDDKNTRANHGLVSFQRLSELWDHRTRAPEFRYAAKLHPIFLRLMERFDLCYRVPGAPLGGQANETSLVAQLVPDFRPEADLQRVWPSQPADGDEQQVQICRIVEAKNGQSAAAEGLFFQLIVRLHRFSLGRIDFKESVHWQRGLVLDDEYNGRALLEHVGNDVRIAVRAAYPEKLLSVLTREVEYLVENFWEGLRCDVMVPCIEPCGRNAPGTGLYEVEKLIKSKKRGEYPCPVCNDWQSIDSLLRNAPAARRTPIEVLIDERFKDVKSSLDTIRREFGIHDRRELQRFRKLNQNDQRVLSEVDDLYGRIMRAFTDEAKEGPRLFTLQPVEQSVFNPNGWAKKIFRVTLWCEHTRLPLPLINKHDNEGVYEFEVTREWFAKAAPFLKVLTGTLSLVLPVAASVTKLALDEAVYKSLEDQLDLGKECAEAMLSATEKTTEWLAEKEGPGAEHTGMIRADGGVLREFQTWLKKEDPSFGNLRRVLNKRQEFLWVHRDYEKEY